MTEEMIGNIFQMISTSGAAKSKYIEAIRSVKEGNSEKAKDLIKEGEECFNMAHKIHSEFLTQEAGASEDGIADTGVSLFLVHAEDQMMSVETIKLLADEVIDLYKFIRNEE